MHMNRRDMIIVAALINAGLLVILFISAVSSKDHEETYSIADIKKTPVELEKAVPLPPKPLSIEGQIDQVISDYSAKVAEKEKTSEIKPLPLPKLPSEPKIAGKKVETSQLKLNQTLEGQRSITIEKGDVLERIARQNGVSVEEIMKLNNLSNSRLQIGQTLQLPPKSKESGQKKQIETVGKYYTVKGGDSPWTIAQKNGMQVEELLELNQMDEEKAKRLRPGDKLKIK